MEQIIAIDKYEKFLTHIKKKTWEKFNFSKYKKSKLHSPPFKDV